MIYLTRLDGSTYVLNADRIEMIEACPDTVITTIDGKHFLASEKVEEVVARIIAYQRNVRRAASGPEDLTSEGITHG